MKVALFLASALALAAGSGQAQAGPAPQDPGASAARAPASDYEGHLVRGLRERMNAQIALDKLAIARGVSPDVARFAQDDIALLNQSHVEITAIGDRYDLTAPKRRGPPPGPGVGGPPPRGSVNSQSLQADLEKLEGALFERTYLLLSALHYEEYQRAIALEVESPQANAELKAWSQGRVEPFRAQARRLQKLVLGEGAGVDNPLNRERGAADLPR